MTHEPRRLGDLIAQILKSSVKPRWKEMAEVSAAWDRAVGEDLARRSRPMSLRNGELRVSFDSAVLRQEVDSFRKTEILERLRKELPDLRVASLKCVLK